MYLLYSQTLLWNETEIQLRMCNCYNPFFHTGSLYFHCTEYANYPQNGLSVYIFQNHCTWSDTHWTQNLMILEFKIPTLHSHWYVALPMNCCWKVSNEYQCDIITLSAKWTGWQCLVKYRRIVKQCLEHVQALAFKTEIHSVNWSSVAHW